VDDWIGHILLKEHIGLLGLMFDQCRQLYISLSLKKCMFCVPFGNLLGHISCIGSIGEHCKDSSHLKLPTLKNVKLFSNDFVMEA